MALGDVMLYKCVVCEKLTSGRRGGFPRRHAECPGNDILAETVESDVVKKPMGRPRKKNMYVCRITLRVDRSVNQDLADWLSSVPKGQKSKAVLRSLASGESGEFSSVIFDDIDDEQVDLLAAFVSEE